MSRNTNESLTCSVDRFENGHAVLIFKFTQNNRAELVIPKRYLPRKIKEGDILSVEVYPEKEAKERQKNLASNILDEILKSE